MLDFEARAVSVKQSDPEFLEKIGYAQFYGWSDAAVPVTTEKALGVPAVWSAVNFIAGTIAGLPLEIFRRRRNGTREQVRTGVAPILHDAVNDEMSSFDWRKYTLEQVLTTGRAITFIERSPSGRILNLWPLEPARVTVRRSGGRTTYRYEEEGIRPVVYGAADVIDVAFMLSPDRITHRSPIHMCREAIALAIAATDYGAKYFRNGGVPPFMITGAFQSGASMGRAAEDLEAAVRKAAKEGRQAVVLPTGLEVKPIGSSPEDGQLLELKRFCVEEIARIYSIPPTFLQDLTHGTFSNTEQQDLHFVKHTVKRWLEQFEQEMNLKLFGRGGNQYVEFNLDGLLRGDFATRMEGYATAIQNGIRTPNEVRRKENLAPIDGGDDLFIQGATVPIVQAGQKNNGDQNGL